jgi:hypothetical protein
VADKMSPEEKLELLYDMILGDPIDEYGHYNLIVAGQFPTEMENCRVRREGEIIEELVASEDIEWDRKHMNQKVIYIKSFLPWSHLFPILKIKIVEFVINP